MKRLFKITFSLSAICLIVTSLAQQSATLNLSRHRLIVNSAGSQRRLGLLFEILQLPLLV